MTDESSLSFFESLKFRKWKLSSIKFYVTFVREFIKKFSIIARVLLISSLKTELSGTSLLNVMNHWVVHVTLL